jgi:hypothetical protein
MGKLNIAHHKSYHPYRLDNIERVRRDEAAAKLKQTEDADRVLVAVSLRLHPTYSAQNPLQDAESRMDVLRSRAGISTPPHSPLPGDRDAEGSAPPVASGPGTSSIPMSDGHINLFADLEEHAAALAARASKSKPALTDTDRGIALAPTKQDLNPWYSSSGPKESDDADKTAAARRCVSIHLFQHKHLNYALFPDSAIWRAKSELTRLPRFPRTSCDHQPPIRRCPYHPTATHHLDATSTHRSRSRSQPRHPHHARAVWCVSPPSESARWHLCGVNSASVTAQRAPLRRRARYTAAATRTCLIESRLRTRIVGVTARGACGAGRRTTLVTASAHGRGGIESLAWELGSRPFFSMYCTLLSLCLMKPWHGKHFYSTVICILQFSVLYFWPASIV